jgi:hypothetical protein
MFREWRDRKNVCIYDEVWELMIIFCFPKFLAVPCHSTAPNEPQMANPSTTTDTENRERLNNDDAFSTSPNRVSSME